MASKPDRRGGDAGYFVRFFVTALILVSGTLVLVLVVLPQRYVLDSGFKESALGLPAAAVPFTPVDPVRVAALRANPTATAGVSVERGPAETFWSEVLPLLREGRRAEAVPLFDAYLAAHPDDADVRRELAVTLLAAGDGERAVILLRDVLRSRDDRALRLLLARTLRDLRRLDEASAEYERLWTARPRDEQLALEWARALSWPERYGEAEAVLGRALDASPRSLALRAELARILYYTNRLAAAAELLAPMTDEELGALGAIALRDDIRAALAVPEPPPPPPPPPAPTLLQRALAAREDDDFEEARALFQAAAASTPDDPEVWLGYANLLEYELSDFEGALRALREVERLGAADEPLRFRMALLEAWTGHGAYAGARLRELLAELGTRTPPVPAVDGAATVTRAEIHALLGDLERWEGRRLDAADRYELALESDPGNARALDGLAALRIEVALLVDDVERPRLGSDAYGLADTDDFGRFDLGGAWSGTREGWVWGASMGQRWLSGRAVPGATTELRGAFVEVAPARWWRWGTIRTAVRVGAEWVREGATDVGLGAAAQYRPVGGGVYGLEYARGPAYDLTATLQSAAALVRQDRVVASASRPLGRWSVAAQADVAVLDAVEIPGARASTRTQAAVSVSRALDDTWSVGWSGLALRYSEAAPAPAGLRLFWDPVSAVSTGPFASARGRLSESWQASARVGGGVSLIDERGSAGYDAVPQLGADVRLEHTGARLRTAVDAFYAQSRLEGYRTYGVRFSVSAASWLNRAPGR